MGPCSSGWPLGVDDRSDQSTTADEVSKYVGVGAIGVCGTRSDGECANFRWSARPKMAPRWS